MRNPKPVTDLAHGLVESQNQRDARIEDLWARLDPGRTGELDLKGLQKGFRKIDHPMKNADEMLKRIMREVDTSGDGKIQFEEFRTFVERAEMQLYQLFRTIDKDGNGKLDMKELQVAFKSAGLTVSTRRLEDFFNDMDVDRDGYVEFVEWRDFLMFMPGGHQLGAVITFYHSLVSVTPEGDSTVSEETLQGLGMGLPRSLLHSLVGFLRAPFLQKPMAVVEEESVKLGPLGGGEGDAVDTVVPQADAEIPPKKYTLTDFIPDPGYFLAGAIAGGVSRTATAPLDRLKVYLLVNTTSSAETAARALRQARPLAALKNAASPFGAAVRDLYGSGGVRGFFAGNGLNVVKIMPETAIKFGSYEAAKRTLANLEGHGDPKRINSYSRFTAGGVAGMIAQFCVYPLDTLKFRLQCETVKDGLTGSALVRQTAVRMWSDGGIRAAYRGVTMGLIGMFPYSAIDMGMFEFLKKTYRTHYARYAGCHEDDAHPGNVATGIIGATSGAVGATVVYPLNVVRTRLQTQGTVMHRATYTGIWDATRKTVKGEGYRGLYKGLTPNLLKVAPALSITWVVYENSKKVLGLE